jgi:hypothetical protein
MLQLVKESALAPAAMLQQPTICHFLTTHFLNVELLPCDVVISILRDGLERACSTMPPTAVPGVTNPVSALELLNSSYRELSHELISLSSSCTGTGAQLPPALDSARARLSSDASYAKAFVDEIQRISNQALDGQPHVYVGALARAFPAHMSFENALTCIVDLALSTKSSDPGTSSFATPCLTPTEHLSPLRSPATISSPDGGVSPAHDDADDRACAFLTAASRRSSVPSQEDGLSGSGALGSSARGLSTMGTSFWSPRTTMTDGDAILATADTPSTSIPGGPERTAEVARLLAEYGGWHESTCTASVRCERQLFLNFEGYRPAGRLPSLSILFPRSHCSRTCVRVRARMHVYKQSVLLHGLACVICGCCWQLKPQAARALHLLQQQV